jgi:AraC family transcriptional regulator
MTLTPLRIETSKALTLAGRNGTFPIGPSPGIKDLWASFMTDFGKIEGQVGLKSYGLCHSFDGKGMMDYMAAVEVADAGQVPGYLFTLTIPARKVAVFAHEGPLEGISETWTKIFGEGLASAELTVAPGPQFEAYPDDLGLDGATTPIEIHIPVT